MAVLIISLTVGRRPFFCWEIEQWEELNGLIENHFVDDGYTSFERLGSGPSQVNGDGPLENRACLLYLMRRETRDR
ncbi:hypothetical protein SCA6_019775 [Theobroma cacao]